MSDDRLEHDDETQDRVANALASFAMRGIGPAFMGGRIADLAIHPSKPNRWFVGVGSGGVWRTENAGITWTPVFDEQTSYSVGCVRIDPSRPWVIWVGSGEAVSGRHVGWGDGVYRSDDGGDTWRSVGLEWSEHISDILIDPRDGQVVYVAAEGPLWSSGGERGLYKTVDGGDTWQRVLHVDDDTGVTSAVFAPDDPDTIVAATYQRRRRVWSFLGGGPGSGIHVSNDAGASWERADRGLPKGEMGRIGLAVTPADPDLVYATIEAAEEDERGFYRSTNRGRSWERRNSYLSGGTGPHYYQELFASPSDSERVYQVDVFLQVTDDGGATFRQVEDAKHKHSDNHLVWIDPDDDDHLIVGCDAGLYESHDQGREWRHVSNLPISQFYRVAVDNGVPFTNVLGGAQDLGTLRGPTRTTHVDGVRNQDWSVVLGADGYHAAFDPDDEAISYVSWQVGNVMRHDRRTMELTDIRPEPSPGEPPERWNWDAPIIASAHEPGRIYLASHRLWRSDDRGDGWTPISPDLTGAANRYEIPVAERVVSVDSLYDHMAMSWFATISAIAESPVDADLLYVGTDDGRLHVTEDGGGSWREAERPPGLPATAFINDLEPSRHDSDKVIVAADDHKSGEYTPYLFESADRGRSWRSVAGDLAEGNIVWSIEQDHVEERLLFAGAERGLFVSLDHGERWHRLGKDVPPISFRDLAVQRRDDDLIGATFGRGFYVFDDYSPLRALASRGLEAPATLFEVRDAWWYVPYQPMQAAGQPTLGSTAFRTENPPFGATFTYHLADDLRSATQARHAQEREAVDAGDDVPFPGWGALRDEAISGDPVALLLVRDAEGEAVRVIEAQRRAGLHRTTWDLRGPAPDPVDLEAVGFKPPWESDPLGPLVAPGEYSVELVHAGPSGIETLAGPQNFTVVPVPASATTGEADQHLFGTDTANLLRRISGAAAEIAGVRDRFRHLQAAITSTPNALALLDDLTRLRGRLDDVAGTISGDAVLERFSEPARPSCLELVRRVAGHHWQTTGAPTRTQRDTVARAAAEFDEASVELRSIVDRELPRLQDELDAAGGPWTPR